MTDFEIIRNYKVLHFDDHPILFIGFNQMDNVVIGSFLFEDENENLKFFHSIVPNVIASNFLNRHISYLQVLEKAAKVYIVTKDYNYKTISYKKVDIRDVDPDILPLSNSFAPDLDDYIKFDYQHDYLTFYSAKYIDLESVKNGEVVFQIEKNTIISPNSKLDRISIFTGRIRSGYQNTAIRRSSVLQVEKLVKAKSHA